MKSTYTYIFLLFLISIFSATLKVNAQENVDFRRSLRLGVEVSYPLRTFLEPEIKQYEASLDYEFSENWFAVFEAGMIDVNVVRESFAYFSDGLFFRTGVDFNILGEGVLKDNDKLYAGIRYSYCTQQHRADDIIITDPYWGGYATSFEKSEFDAHWAELTVGVKTELFANLFIGWSIRFKLVLSGANESMVNPYRIGGFGSGDKSTAFDFNYSVYYRIPF